MNPIKIIKFDLGHFLLFKLFAEHTAPSTFIQLVESNWCNISEKKKKKRSSS